MSEIQIQNEIEKLKTLSNNWIEWEELDEAKSILEVIKSGKASKQQLEEIIKILDREVKNFPAGNFVAVNTLNWQKEDFEKLLSNYNAGKQVIVDTASEWTQDVKWTIVTPIEASTNTLNAFNEKNIKKYQKRIENVISKLDLANENQKKLKEELEKLLENPSNTQVEIVQNIIISLWGKVSKSGNADWFFGGLTIKALEKIVWIKTIEADKHKTKAKNIWTPSIKWNPTTHTNEIPKTKTSNELKNINFQNIVIDKATEDYILKHDLNTILKNMNKPNLSKDAWLYKLKTQLEKNNISPEEYIKWLKNQEFIITIKRTWVKAKDWSIMSWEFSKYKWKLELVNWTRKHTDWRVDIYKNGEKVDYTMKYMALMAIMVWVDVAWFTWVWTIPSLIAWTWYDIYDLTQKEDAWWQVLKKMWLVDSRFYAWDKWILEYSLNALWLVPGMTAVAKWYQIQKFYKWLSAAEKAEFSRLESFIKDRFFWIWEVSAKKWKIWQEYSKEANDLKKAREKAAKEKKKTKTTSESEVKKEKAPHDYKWSTEAPIDAKAEPLVNWLKKWTKTTEETIKTEARSWETISDEIFETFTKTWKVWDEVLEWIAQKIAKNEKITDRELAIQQSFWKEIEAILQKSKKAADEWVKTWDFSKMWEELEKKYWKEKAWKIMEKLLSALSWLKKVKKFFPEALQKDIDNWIWQFTKDIFFSKWNLIWALWWAWIDQFLLDDYVDWVDRMEVFLKSVFIWYLAWIPFNIAGKWLKYTLSWTSAVWKFIWKHKWKIVLWWIWAYLVCERTNYNSFSEMFTDWLTKEKTPTPTYTEESEIPEWQ